MVRIGEIMKWSKLTSVHQLDEILKESKEKPVLIFKYSSRCSLSRMALDRLERNWVDAEMTRIKPYFLDLISFREISDQIATRFAVEHESPQVLIIENERSVYDQSHMAIEYQKIREAAKSPQLP